MKKLLITGIDGFLGLHLAKTVDITKYDVLGTYFVSNDAYSEFAFPVEFLDITDYGATTKVLSSFNPDIIIHTAGLSNVDEAERNSGKSYDATFLGTWHIAQWCKKSSCRLIYCSSNAIFSGQEAPYNELSIPNPMNKYGKHKFMAESIVRLLDNYLIFRLILMYGWNFYTRANPVTYVIDKLKAGERLNMVSGYSYINPLYVGSCCNAIWTSINKNINKDIYHLGGLDRVDRYELAVETAKVFGLDTSLINPVNNDFFATLAHRPYDSTYITAKAERELDFKPLSVNEGLSIMKRSLIVEI